MYKKSDQPNLQSWVKIKDFAQNRVSGPCSGVWQCEGLHNAVVRFSLSILERISVFIVMFGALTAYVKDFYEV